MNLETIWCEEMTLITSLKFFQFKELFLYIDQRYAKNFPDSVATQSKLVDGRQKIESIVSDKMKSAEMVNTQRKAEVLKKRMRDSRQKSSLDDDSLSDLSDIEEFLNDDGH